MKNPRITVVTVCYNAVSTIEKTILSVINQTYDNIEYIVVDGASTDGTVDIIKKYDERIAKWVNEPDKGIYDAMNKGISLATGDWINFMNAGDEFVNNEVIQSFSSCIIDNCSVYYGDAIHRYKFGERIVKSRPLKDIYKSMVFSHQSCFVKSNIFFNTKYRYAADYDMLLNLYLNHSKFCNVGFPIATVLVDEGITTSNYGKSKSEARIIQIKAGISSITAYRTFIMALARFHTARIIKRLAPNSLKRWIIKREK